MCADAPKAAPYGSWKSPITSDLIAAESIGLAEVCLDGEDFYWLESRPSEGGRNVVARGRPGGVNQDVTPAPFNVRTRVHEYGGGAWTVSNGTLYFSHDSDRRLYRLDSDTQHPVALTPEGAWRYADGVIDHRRAQWIGVREDHTDPNVEPVNSIVAVSTNNPGLGAGRVLAAGHNFFSSPRLSPDASMLAWLAWDHPNMPWMGTTLYLASLDESGVPGEPTVVAGGNSESIFQTEWSLDGSSLFFASDRTGWWNLYRYDLTTFELKSLAPMSAEFGQPQWLFGMSTYSILDAEHLVCSYTSKGQGALALLNSTSGKLSTIDTPFNNFFSVRAKNRKVMFRGGAAAIPWSIVLLDLDSGKSEILKKSTLVVVDAGLNKYFTPAQTIEYPTENGKTAFGLYYPPFNPDYAPPEGDKPPLLVRCHGGPTGAAFSTLDLRVQYWTSRGIAFLDVNYGGSTGFGREFRERLHLNWGVVDLDDCVNGAKFLVQQDLADESRCVITGGSAGGYTALAALAFRSYFSGGASHYGVSDIAALARDTHKFESRYMDWLIGRYPEQKARYQERSPIYHVGQLSKPVIFLQGEEDAIVPPSQSELMVEALRRRGIPVGYLLFSGEQHGFRKAEHIKRALDAELYFYAVNVFRTGLSF
jgi:dipeptidyl aminopeptidase/acylaminoacyl peptidase